MFDFRHKFNKEILRMLQTNSCNTNTIHSNASPTRCHWPVRLHRITKFSTQRRPTKSSRKFKAIKNIRDSLYVTNQHWYSAVFSTVEYGNNKYLTFENVPGLEEAITNRVKFRWRCIEANSIELLPVKTVLRCNSARCSPWT